MPLLYSAINHDDIRAKRGDGIVGRKFRLFAWRDCDDRLGFNNLTDSIAPSRSHETLQTHCSHIRVLRCRLSWGESYCALPQPQCTIVAPPPKSEQPVLTVDSKHLDFGEVWETDKFEWTVPVLNRSDSSLRVSAYSVSCSCIAPTSTSDIPAGGTAPLTFRIDLHSVVCASAKPQAVSDAKIAVALGQDTSTEKLLVAELTGRVKRAIAAPTSSIDFGRFVGSTNPKSRVVPIRSLVALRELNATVEGFAVRAELKTIGSDQWELQLTPATSTILGRHEAKVRLHPITTSGEQVPATTINVGFDVLHDIQPDSSVVPLGTGVVGDNLTGTLTVTSLSGQVFALPKCECGTATVQAPTLGSPQSSYTFTIHRKITASGNHTAPLTVRGVGADGKDFEFRVDVQWYGVSP